MSRIGTIASAPWFRAALALALVVVIGLVFHADGTFYKWDTHRDMLRQMSVFGILACGMTVVIITAGIDLSVGSVLGFTAVLFCLMTVNWGWPALVTVPLCILAGTALGTLSGSVIARFGVQPFIATLAMMVFARGFAKYVSGGRKIDAMIVQDDGSFHEPPVFNAIDTAVFGENIAIVTLILAACIILCGTVLGFLRIGRYLYAVGGNEEASRLSGLPVRLTKVFAYAFSGAMAGIAGVCQAAQDHQGDPEAGATYELTAIAMVVIGGTSLMGGRGGILLTLVGMLTIGYLEKVLSINAVGEASRLMLTGGIIVGAVLFQRSRAHA